MKITSYSINNYKTTNLRPDLTVEDIKRNPEWKDNLFAFVSLLYNPGDELLYCGMTHFGGDILYTFDPRTKKFRSLGYPARFAKASEYDVKIHRSLELDVDQGVIYGIASGLHSTKDYMKVPGAHLFAYRCASGKFEDLGCPVPHEYTQTIVYDPRRKIIYGFTLEYFSFYAYSLNERRTLYHSRPNSIPHIAAIDDDGCVWSTWDRTNHYLFKYDPGKNDCEYFTTRFPETCGNLMYPGAGPIDRMLNIGDGFLYAALDTGSLYRLNPKSCALEFLGRPTPRPRLPGLTLGFRPQTLVGATGDNFETVLFEYDLAAKRFAGHSVVRNEREACFRPHDIAVVGDTAYIAETDNPLGGCSLWEVANAQL